MSISENDPLDSHFDKEFLSIDTLKWDPWVGIGFQSSPDRIMVAGESHYLHENGQGQDGYDKMFQYSKTRQVTRDVIWEVVYDKCWKNQTLERVTAVLFGEQFKGNAFDQIVYYNFIQRPMDYRIKERPSADDYVIG